MIELKKSTIWDPLSKTLEANSLEQLAEKLNINYSTLRGQKSRNAIPYEEIIDILNANQLTYVFKNEDVENSTAVDDVGLLFEPTGYNVCIKKMNDEIVKFNFEHFLISLMQRIEDVSFSKQTKIRIIDTLIDIVEKDLDKSLVGEHPYSC